MSRILLIVAIAVIGVGAYFYVTQPEQTPADELQSAAQEADDAASDVTEAARQAVSDALDSAAGEAAEAAEAAQEAVTDAADQAAESASSIATQAGDAATDAGDQIAALAQQGQDLFNSWIEEGTLSTGQFDYDSLVASVQDSALAQEVKTQAIVILDEIKASPETLVTKLQELRQLLTQPQ